MNTFVSTFTSGVQRREEDTTHTSVNDYVLFAYGSWTQFYDIGGSAIEMISNDSAAEEPVTEETVNEQADDSDAQESDEE